MASISRRFLILLTLAAFSAAPMLAAEEGQQVWQALGASAYRRTFATVLSARKPTEAVKDMHDACKEHGHPCTLIAAFTTGCRYVALGGRPIARQVLEPVFGPGSTPEEAQQKCKSLGLVCEREPQGACRN